MTKNHNNYDLITNLRFIAFHIISEERHRFSCFLFRLEYTFQLPYIFILKYFMLYN